MFFYSKRLLTMTAILLMINDQILCRPGGEWNENECELDQDLTEICQKCAKRTKSNDVYPLCCNRADEVHHWCTRFMTYGKVA